MKRSLALSAIGAVAAVAAWQAVPAFQTEAEPETEAAPKVAPKPAPPRPAATDQAESPQPKAPPPVSKVTPMAERVAIVGLLNKRNGLSRDFEMKPGEARLIGDVVIRLKACEKTEPWEQDKLTGAFVQVIVRESNQKWYKVFSGWLFKESPSLNVVEHPVYDVWAKDCKMRFPDTGPETTVVRGQVPGASDSSKARKSAGGRERAADNNDT
jgi:hypothetical protein